VVKSITFHFLFAKILPSILLQDAYDTAKSTLLRALQGERGNVHELETVVTSLQQNNSAISEMVESRDTIIDELNNRIAVFEEDKVVLKAALRQLQKEIKEETPKAQKLLDDLANAEKGEWPSSELV
jgi:chromosome segregation ATPase